MLADTSSTNSRFICSFQERNHYNLYESYNACDSSSYAAVNIIVSLSQVIQHLIAERWTRLVGHLRGSNSLEDLPGAAAYLLYTNESLMVRS